jgi:hypothetical protein
MYDYKIYLNTFLVFPFYRQQCVKVSLKYRIKYEFMIVDYAQITF